jgi:hypothetical protein
MLYLYFFIIYKTKTSDYVYILDSLWIHKDTFPYNEHFRVILNDIVGLPKFNILIAHVPRQPQNDDCSNACGAYATAFCVFLMISNFDISQLKKFGTFIFGGLYRYFTKQIQKKNRLFGFR